MSTKAKPKIKPKAKPQTKVNISESFYVSGIFDGLASHDFHNVAENLISVGVECVEELGPNYFDTVIEATEALKNLVDNPEHELKITECPAVIKFTVELVKEYPVSKHQSNSKMFGIE